jgi:hypothetical protein
MNENDALSPNLHGSAYLIQESVPSRLVGSIVADTPPASPGIVRVGFFENDPAVAVNTEEERISVTIREDIALELAKRLLQVVAQNRALRSLHRAQRPGEDNERPIQ